MLQATALRTSGLQTVGLQRAENRHLIVCNETHRFLVAEQMSGIELRTQIILEPEGRNTAPAVALAALHAVAVHPDVLLLVMPADHVIQDIAAFQTAVRVGSKSAEDGKLLTFGTVPTSPESGYGYIKATTDSNHNKPVAPDLIEQDFTAEAPNEKWVSDISYIWTDEGWLYLAVVMDLYSRAIVGWSMNRRITQELVCDALTMAMFRRGFPNGTIIHSDRGSQYCSKRYQRLISNHGLRCSMGRRATCYDNAAMESFFHTLKVELVHRERYTTRQMAKSKIFEYIETYYNRQRKHSDIGYKIPMQFDQVA